MSLEKFKLFFNSTVGVDDEVKSFLYTADGTALTQTGGALDVNIASPISIDVDLDHTTGDSVQIGDGTDLLAVNADGSINVVATATNLDIRDLQFASDSVDVSGSSVSITGSVAVTATDLDVRDLTHVSDSVKIGDGTDFLAVNADGSINVNATISATDLDIRDLVAATDSVSAWLKDGSGNSIESIGGNLSVADSVLLNSLSAPTVTTTEVAVTAVSGQKKVTIQNLSTEDIYLGPTGVTAGTGLLIPKKSSQEIDLAGTVYLIAGAAAGAGNVRVAHWAAT